jgi:hypothetical protein
MKLYMVKTGSVILRFCPNGRWMKNFKYVGDGGEYHVQEQRSSALRMAR